MNSIGQKPVLRPAVMTYLEENGYKCETDDRNDGLIYVILTKEELEDSD